MNQDGKPANHLKRRQLMDKCLIHRGPGVNAYRVNLEPFVVG